MQFGDYPTPGDVKIYIGNALVDDAYRVDFDERNSKVPLYGYHQKRIAMVADGKLIIVGNIIIHFRFPGYLTFAIKNVLSKREEGALDDATRTDPVASISPPVGSPGGVYLSPDASLARKTAFKLSNKDNVLQSINAIRRMTPEQRVQALTASFKMGYFNQQSALLEAMYANHARKTDGARSSQPSQEESRYNSLESPAEMSPHDFEEGHRGIDLRLYYGYVGTSDQGVYVTEVLKGVHFTGRRKVVNASTSGGDLSSSGQSLLEVYPFFARSVEPLIEDRPPAFLGV